MTTPLPSPVPLPVPPPSVIKIYRYYRIPANAYNYRSLFYAKSTQDEILCSGNEYRVTNADHICYMEARKKYPHYSQELTYFLDPLSRYTEPIRFHIGWSSLSIQDAIEYHHQIELKEPRIPYIVDSQNYYINFVVRSTTPIQQNVQDNIYYFYPLKKHLCKIVYMEFCGHTVDLSHTYRLPSIPTFDQTIHEWLQIWVDDHLSRQLSNARDDIKHRMKLHLRNPHVYPLPPYSIAFLNSLVPDGDSTDSDSD